jgi:hypothetical protein
MSAMKQRKSTPFCLYLVYLVTLSVSHDKVPGRTKSSLSRKNFNERIVEGT